MSEKMKLKKIIYIKEFDKVLKSVNEIKKIKKEISSGKVIIFKNIINNKIISEIKEYLVTIGKGSLPNYHGIYENCPNSHRINRWDNRSYVKACFHQFQFFPWNDDTFDLFNLFRSVFNLKNALNEQPLNKFLDSKSESGCISRVAFQFYPAGIGGMNAHIDPLDFHQSVIPTLVMSKKGEDFKTGGLFIGTEENKLNIDDYVNIGDLILFSPQMVHGVDIIDPDNKDNNFLSFTGRWMCLFAVNKLNNNNIISDSQEID